MRKYPAIVLYVAIWVISRRNAGQESTLASKRVLASGSLLIQLGTVRSSRAQVIKQGPRGGKVQYLEQVVVLACRGEEGAVRGPMVAVVLDALAEDGVRHR
jgi:hypothetical protein